jgi:hypothetical protein
MIEISDNLIKEIEKTLGRYKSKAPVVLYRALNRAVSTARASAAKKTKKEYHIKSSDVKKTITTIKARRSDLGASLVSEGEHVPLDKFRYKPRNPRPSNPPQLKVAIKRDGYKDLKDAFVTDVNGNKIFKRVGQDRLPISRLSGPAVPQMIANEDTADFTEKQAEATFFKRLDHEIKRLVVESGK